VEFVVIGQTAAVLQGAPVSTLDVDIAPAMAFSNAGALSSALRAMDGRHRASPGVPPEIAELGRIGSSPKQFMTGTARSTSWWLRPAATGSGSSCTGQSTWISARGSRCAAQRSRM
jgi:hypothetical protein